MQYPTFKINAVCSEKQAFIRISEEAKKEFSFPRSLVEKEKARAFHAKALL